MKIVAMIKKKLKKINYILLFNFVKNEQVEEILKKQGKISLINFRI